MKKLLLGLLCIGSMLALPGCWCCRKACEEPCEDYCDDYDDYCDDYCDEGHYRCGDEDEDDREMVGYEEQQGYRRPLYRNKKRNEERSPRKVMYKEVHPGIISKAEAEGKECIFLDPRYHRANKKANKAEMMNGSKRQARQAKHEPVEVSGMDMMDEK